MALRGIRGAITADANTAEAIVTATTELLDELITLNDLQVEEIAFAYFTTTMDLDAEYPALAARRLGWVDVPLLCGTDMPVAEPNARSLPKCVRVLLLYNTERGQNEMRSAYLRGAEAIRADLEKTRHELRNSP